MKERISQNKGEGPCRLVRRYPGHWRETCLTVRGLERNPAVFVSHENLFPEQDRGGLLFVPVQAAAQAVEKESQKIKSR